MRFVLWAVLPLTLLSCAVFEEQMDRDGGWPGSPPGPTQIAIEPAAPVVGETLVVRHVGAAWDADGDEISYEYTWSRHGQVQSSLTGAEVDGGLTTAGERWTVQVRAFDGTRLGPATSASVNVDPAPDADADGDGFAIEDGDCNDSDAEVFPGAVEACDGVDGDCDGEVDEGCPAECGDGLAAGEIEECDGTDDAACPGACSLYCACPAAPPGDLEVHMIDVGQGDGLLVISPDGFVMLVDGGGSGHDDEIDAFLASLGLDEIDYTLTSHMHEDHLGSTDEILALHPEIVACFDHGGSYSTTAYLEYDAAAAGLRVPLVAGDTIDLGPSLQAEVLHAHSAAQNENLNSVVLRLEYGDVRVLLGGDCETSGCEDQFDPGPIDVYKVHHHGSLDSSGAPLLSAMMPEVALIPVGAGNAYGHPSSETLSRLNAVGAAVFRTDQDADISVVSDGTGVEVTTAN